MTVSAPPLDVYSQATLSALMPSVLASLGVAGEPNRLHLPDSRHTVVLLIDGLGWTLLRRHREHAPFLDGLAGRPIRAGFPTTTATSIASFGTGLPSGSHGITGYQSYVRAVHGTLNWLSWRAGHKGDELTRLVPEVVQPAPTVFERAAADGITCTTVVPAKFDGSGLTRAVLRGGTFRGIHAYGDLIAHVVAASRSGERTLTYCYLSEIDTLGHIYGPGAESWLQQLAVVDRLVEKLVAGLAAAGPGITLHVTADHGMITVDDADKIDFDSTPALSDGVSALAGEPRCRHVHARAGAAHDVASRWRSELGHRMWIGTRDEAVTAGLFGPAVRSEVQDRIGDVVAIAQGGAAVVRRKAESRLSALPGQHGALSDDELLIPLLHTVTP
ncbi:MULTISPECIES: alkaline phosphatase family protein [unclassified Rhodococcus (in: high G+C Gram-positive bacteria)]|uniref:alkaline phosphatase family protein n=1 Tax=unclassified Rhodococcus (in: high G+C Gram-positive bacteria) TaxID=192944 RepID=UPI00163A6CA4|nr:MULTISPECIES: nucleotide pyrophosphatase/phosphodiesterase family protein [unclassified Rhodococcus (in: high G+C Gram-positive bacteria)]MBC2642547.1 alkaline phosphatase family protein [Rhodococcus sp. 3A]MBC2892711.1 alkaline phosphatase family protein [Rhodococcus sp. 4CII]